MKVAPRQVLAAASVVLGLFWTASLVMHGVFGQILVSDELKALVPNGLVTGRVLSVGLRTLAGVMALLSLMLAGASALWLARHPQSPPRLLRPTVAALLGGTLLAAGLIAGFAASPPAVTPDSTGDEQVTHQYVSLLVTITMVGVLRPFYLGALWWSLGKQRASRPLEG